MATQGGGALLLGLLREALSNDNARIKAAEEQLRALETTPGYYSTMTGIATDKGMAEDVRWMATVTVKNGIDKYWRKSSFHALAEEEKEFIRSRHLVCHDEPSNQVAVQQAVLVTKIARHDVPDKWPELLPALVQHIQNGAVLVKQRSLRMLQMVVKELSKKRIPSAGRQMTEVAPSLFMHVHAMWVSNLDEFFKVVASHRDTTLPNAVRDQLTQQLFFCFYGLKTLRYTYVHFIKEPLQADLASAAQFPDLALKALQSFVDLAMGDAIGPFRDNLTKIVVQLGKFFVDLYRIKTNVFLASPSALSILSFAYDNLVAATQNKYMGTLVGLLIRFVYLLQQSAKKLTDISRANFQMTPADLGNVQILNQFWTADRQRQFFELLVTKYLPLSEVEISQMQEDPEEFIIVEESVSLFESLRVVTEGTIMLFGERMGSVTQLVLQQLLQQALEISPDSPTPTILFKEAVYNVLTLCSFFLHDFIDMDTLLRTRLIPEAAHPNQLSSLVLRRRLACVIEQWNDVKLSPEIRPLVFQVLVSLMGQDQATIVRLAAVKSLRAVVCTFDFDQDQFAPFLEQSFALALNMLQNATENDATTLLMDVLSVLLGRGGSPAKLRPLLPTIMAMLPTLWDSAGTNLSLKIKVIQLASLIIDAFQGDSSVMLPFVVPVLRFCLSTNQEDVLHEEALDLLLSAVRNSPTTLSADLWAFYPLACQIMTRGSANTLKACADIVYSFLLVEPSPAHLMEGAPYLTQVFSWAMSLKSELFKGQSLGIVLKVMDTMLLTHAELALIILHPCLGPFAEALMNPEVDAPMLVHFAYLSLLSRMLLQCRDATLQFMTSGGDAALEKMIITWTDKLVSIGQPSQAKLNAMAIATLLPIKNAAIAKHVESIVNVVLGVVFQTTTENTATGTYNDNLMYEEDEDYSNHSLSEGAPEMYRRRDLMKRDVIYAREIGPHVKEQVLLMQQVYGVAEANKLLSTIDPDLQVPLQKICYSS